MSCLRIFCLSCRWKFCEWSVNGLWVVSDCMVSAWSVHGQCMVSDWSGDVSYHVFHTNSNLWVVVERSKVADNERRATLVQRFHLCHYLTPDCRLDFHVNALKCNEHTQKKAHINRTTSPCPAPCLTSHLIRDDRRHFWQQNFVFVPLSVCDRSGVKGMAKSESESGNFATYFHSHSQVCRSVQHSDHHSRTSSTKLFQRNKILRF